MEQLGYAIFDFHFMRPSEAVQLRNINEFTHRAIRLRGIELHIALKAYGLDHQFRKFTDGQLFTCTYIDMAVTNLAQ